MSERPAFFLCVGFSRCGTSWLHRQLTHHPLVWVPPVKELHYWTVQRERGVFHKYYPWHLRQMRAQSRFDERAVPHNRQRFEDYVQAHGRWALRYFFGWRSDRWYRSLFPASGYAACGEITPNYVFMSEERIAQVHRFDPAAKIIVLMRNPIDRAWSMAAKRFTTGRGRKLEGVSAEVLSNICLGHGRTMRYCPAIERWQWRFGSSQVHLGWYDQLVADKAGFLTSLARFLDIDPGPFLARPLVLEKRQNAIDFGDYRMSQDLRRKMSQILLPMTEELAEAIGGCADAWAKEMRDATADPCSFDPPISPTVHAGPTASRLAAPSPPFGPAPAPATSAGRCAARSADGCGTGRPAPRRAAG